MDEQAIDCITCEPIPDDRLVILKEGNGSNCFDINTLLSSLIIDNNITNPFTRSEISPIIVERIEKYRIENVRTVLVVDKRHKITESYRMSTCYVDIIDRLGDLLMKVVTAINSKPDLYTLKFEVKGIDVDKLELNSLLHDTLFGPAIVTVSQLDGDNPLRAKLTSFIQNNSRYSNMNDLHTMMSGEGGQPTLHFSPNTPNREFPLIGMLMALGMMGEEEVVFDPTQHSHEEHYSRSSDQMNYSQIGDEVHYAQYRDRIQYGDTDSAQPLGFGRREPTVRRTPIAERAPVSSRAPTAERAPVSSRAPIAERAPTPTSQTSNLFRQNTRQREQPSSVSTGPFIVQSVPDTPPESSAPRSTRFQVSNQSSPFGPRSSETSPNPFQTSSQRTNPFQPSSHPNSVREQPNPFRTSNAEPSTFLEREFIILPPPPGYADQHSPEETQYVTHDTDDYIWYYLPDCSWTIVPRNLPGRHNHEGSDELAILQGIEAMAERYNNFVLSTPNAPITDDMGFELIMPAILVAKSSGLIILPPVA